MLVHLERPELFRLSPARPFARFVQASLLRAGQLAATESAYQPNIAVLVRTKNDKVGLGRILDHVKRAREVYNGRIDVVVVDTESKDGTLKIAKDFGASIVTLKQAEFTYAKSVNLGLEVISDDVVATFITVGHAQPCLSNCVVAGARWFQNPKVAGVFSVVLPHENAKVREKLEINWFVRRLRRKAQPIQTVKPGNLANTNAMIRMELWRLHPYDDAYGGGGEDSEWAKWAMGQGYDLIFDSALTVHHSHGLSLLNTIRQSRHWREVYNKPTNFRTEEIAKRRPDLFKD